MVNTVLSSMTVAVAAGDDATSLLQVFAAVRQHSQGQRIVAAVAQEGSTTCVEAAVGDVAPVAGSFTAQMSQQAVEVAAGSVAEQVGSFCVAKQDVLLMQRTFGLNTARDFEAALGAKKRKQTTTTTTDFENFDFVGDLQKDDNHGTYRCPSNKAALLQTMDTTVAHKDSSVSPLRKEQKERLADEMRVCECRSFLKSSVGKMWNDRLFGTLAALTDLSPDDDAQVDPPQQQDEALLQRNFDVALATKKKKKATTTTTTTTVDHQSQVEDMTEACTKASELDVGVWGTYGMAEQVQLPSWAIVAKLLNDPDIADVFKQANITEGWQHCDKSWVVHGACSEFIEGYCRGHGRACYNSWSRKASQAAMKKDCRNNQASEDNAVEKCVEYCKLHVDPEASPAEEWVLAGDRFQRNPWFGHKFTSKSEEDCAQECPQVVADFAEKNHNIVGQKMAKALGGMEACAEPGALHDACDCVGK